MDAWAQWMAAHRGSLTEAQLVVVDVMQAHGEAPPIIEFRLRMVWDDGVAEWYHGTSQRPFCATADDAKAYPSRARARAGASNLVERGYGRKVGGRIVGGSFEVVTFMSLPVASEPYRTASAVTSKKKTDPAGPIEVDVSEVQALLAASLSKHVDGFVGVRSARLFVGMPALVPGKSEMRLVLDVDLTGRADGADCGMLIVAQRMKEAGPYGKTFAELSSVGRRIAEDAPEPDPSDEIALLEREQGFTDLGGPYPLPRLAVGLTSFLGWL